MSSPESLRKKLIEQTDVFFADTFISGVEIMQEAMKSPQVQRQMAKHAQLAAVITQRPRLRSAPDISKERTE